MSKPKLEVADIFRHHGDTWRTANAGHVSLPQRRVMTAIEICRTAALGGHVERCEDCAHTRIAYNSCRNRHCPKCQWSAAERWLAARQAELLPVPYFHVVFTLPAAIGAIAYQNKAKVYGLLFSAAAETLATIAADRKHLGAAIGLTAVLHTWGQNLDHHPHVHCIVPAAASHPTANAGYHAGQVSFYRCGCSRVSFAGCSSTASSLSSMPANYNSSTISPRTRIARRSCPISRRFASANWWSLPSVRSQAPSRSSPIWPAIPIASPSATAGSSNSPMSMSPSAGRTTARRDKQRA